MLHGGQDSHDFPGAADGMRHIRMKHGGRVDRMVGIAKSARCIREMLGGITQDLGPIDIPKAPGRAGKREYQSCPQRFRHVRAFSRAFRHKTYLGGFV
jgi:hypothetical protein